MLPFLSGLNLVGEGYSIYTSNWKLVKFDGLDARFLLVS